MKKILTLVALIMATISAQTKAQESNNELTNTCKSFDRVHLIDIVPKFSYCNFRRTIKHEEAKKLIEACEKTGSEISFTPLMIVRLESPKIHVKCKRGK